MGFYASPYYSNKLKLQDQRYSIQGQMRGTQLIIEDFNAIFYIKDKIGGRGVGNSNDATFIGFFNYMGGIAIDFIGNKYTWDNKRKRKQNIHVRLNRAICNDL